MIKNTIMRRVVILCASVAVLAAALILWFVPWRTQIDVTLPCVEVTQEGQVLGEGIFSIKGWYCDYLFQEDTVTIDHLYLPGYEITGMMMDTYQVSKASNSDPSEPMLYIWPWFNTPESYYDPDVNTVVAVFPADLDFEDVWVIRDIYAKPERFFVACADEDADYAAIMESCGSLITAKSAPSNSSDG